MAPRRWTPDTITTELQALTAELGRFPTSSEFTARGLSGLYRAIRRDGVDVWKERIAAAPAAATPTPEQIAEAAYFLHLQGAEADDDARWLRAERELHTAGIA
jgi:hypothetical protein